MVINVRCAADGVNVWVSMIVSEIRTQMFAQKIRNNLYKNMLWLLKANRKYKGND